MSAIFSVALSTNSTVICSNNSCQKKNPYFVSDRDSNASKVVVLNLLFAMDF